MISVRPCARCSCFQLAPQNTQCRTQPISEVCGASENTFKKGKKCQTKSSVMGAKKGRNNSENVKVREGAEKGVLQAPEKTPPQTVGENTMKKVVLLQPMKNCAGPDIHSVTSGQLYAGTHGHFLKPLEISLISRGKV